MKKTNGTPESVLAVVSSADPKKFVNLTALTGRAIAIRQAADSLLIGNDEDEMNAADRLKEIKLIGNEAESLRKENVNPFNELVKKVNAFFKPISTDLEAAESSIKGKILSYRRYKEDLRLAEERKREEEYRKQVEAERKEAEDMGDDAYVPPPPPLPVIQNENTTRGQVGAASTRRIWKFRVTDIRKVPDGMLLIDSAAVNARIRNIVSNGGDPTNAIPGVEAFQEESISVR